MSQFTLKEVIRQTIFSIADNDNNKLMTGELFEIEENDLKVVSLDGHRISIRNIELKNNYSHKKLSFPEKHFRKSAKSFRVVQKMKYLFSWQTITSFLSLKIRQSFPVWSKVNTSRLNRCYLLITKQK